MQSVALIFAVVHEEYKYTLATGKFVQLDVHIPELQLAFEYQGEQHYKPMYWVESLSILQKRDNEKRESCIKVETDAFITDLIGGTDFDCRALLVGFHKTKFGCNHSRYPTRTHRQTSQCSANPTHLP